MELMKSIVLAVFTVVLSVNVVLGMALNGFIVVMNFQSWRRKGCLRTGDKIVTSLCLGGSSSWRRKGCLRTGDKIVTGLCLSRWIFQALYGLHHTLQWFMPRAFLLGYANQICVLGRIVLNYTTIWFASLLCVYYCVKITNYKHVAFLYLKARMSTLAPWLGGLCVLFSLVLSLPYGWQVFTSDYTGKIHDGSPNTTKRREGPYVYFIGSSPPFIIFSIAFFLTVPSLWRHIRTMSGVGSSFRSPDVGVHCNAIKSMAAFFLLHILFIVCINITFSGVMEIGVPYNSTSFVLSSFYLFLHSAVIIYYNRRLQEPLLGLFTGVLRSSWEK